MSKCKNPGCSASNHDIPVYGWGVMTPNGWEFPCPHHDPRRAFVALDSELDGVLGAVDVLRKRMISFRAIYPHLFDDVGNCNISSLVSQASDLKNLLSER